MSEPARPGDGLAPALKLAGIAHGYRQGTARLDVLKGVDLEISAGEIVALTGPSGSGKSTLLHIAGLLEQATSGDLWLAGQPVSALDDGARTRLRRDRLGFVFQFHHLLPEFSAEENVMLPALIAGRGKAAARARARELLALVGLSERLDHRPGELSGGEQQRVAIARAFANQPDLLLADEPTGNLDPATADQVFKVFIEVMRNTGRAALIATHNPVLAAAMDRTVTLADGRLAAA
ncbi:MAG: ABC transporter ATP-binding protein [Alphaproteobacteria bacterium]|nr:ABC transporter ATP-binding protein [Pseudomonadota bacterium]TDI64514.1 MAG: ABC transporter ATP-binding protein [Alphaproteobacteria bacterium]